MGPLDSDPERPHALRPVRAPGFEGPLDLLLNLIEEGKYDVSQVSLAAVTDQYLTYVRQADVPPEHLAEFLVVAATLLLLKSRTMFPDMVLDLEEEANVASLEAQLREYRKFRAAARWFSERWSSSGTLYARESFQGAPVTFAPPKDLGVTELRAKMESVLRSLPAFEMIPRDVLRRVVSIEERIRDIQSRLFEQARTTFGALASSARSKLEFIVSFLALLELVKQQLVAVEQFDPFRDIVVSRRDAANGSGQSSS